MSVFIFLIVVSSFIFILLVGSMIWALKTGQMDDLETPPERMLWPEPKQKEKSE